MSAKTTNDLPEVKQRPGRKPVIPSPELGMIIFICTEVMFFTALISAFLVIKAGAGNWVPPEDVRLPILATSVNTCFLVISGLLMLMAGRLYKEKETRDRAVEAYLRSTILGAIFVCFQGWEWVQLIQYGFTMQAGIFAATFFLVIGSHGLHAAATVIAMIWHYRAIKKHELTISGFRALQYFWLFVVCIWPILFGLVYF
ncbi:MAG: hypothetical protein CMP10_04175 [Zetaproteobacteria bacterium]|nr:hypothetical protein [Pseudobdellovibrionaceae bacterium]